MGHHLNLVLGVELNRISDALWSCRTCLLAKAKQSLSIESHKITEGPLAVIFEALPRAYPIALTLTGKGIMNKNLQLMAGQDFDQVFHHAFPSIEPKQFYVQQFVQTENVLLSLMRKQELDDLLDQLKRAGLTVFVVSLGGIVTASIWPQLNIYDAEILFDGHVFQRNNEGLFLSYSYNPGQSSQFPLKIEQEFIAEEQILAYASAFQLLLHQQVSLVNANVEEINTKFADFLIHSQMKKRAMFFLLGLLMALLISFMLFAHYNEENTKRLQALGAYTANADQLDLLKTNIAGNEALLKRLNWNGGYNYGFLLNEIGSGMPKQLQLLEISMDELKPDMTITGLTSNLSAVNNWIFTLKEKPWIKAVNLAKFQENADTELYQFNLMITYGDVAEAGR